MDYLWPFYPICGWLTAPHSFGSFSSVSAEMSGTGTEISLVHWKQRWLDNGTLYFHVSLSGAEQLAQVTEPTERQPAHVLHEHAHLLHVSVMVRSPTTPPLALYSPVLNPTIPFRI